MKVLIKVTRKTEYASFVKMSKGQYEAFQKQLEGDSASVKSAQNKLNRMVDAGDWQDDELHTLDAFEPVKV